MNHLTKDNITYYCDPSLFYNSLIKDVNNAKEHIFIEIYKIGGNIAKLLHDALIIKAKEGVKIKLLLDYWGSDVSSDFFKELEDLGGDIKFFRIFKFSLNFISYNNSRDHRKIIVIDNVSYLGSCNLSDHCISWREFIVRVEDPVFVEKLKFIFLDNFKIHNFFFHSAKKHLKPLHFNSIDFVRDVPSIRYQRIRNRHVHLIRRAKSEIIIETPYFVPDTKVLIALIKAAKRGVDVKLIIPKESDVSIVDVLAQSVFGVLHNKGVKVFSFSPGFNHSKVSLIDGKYFSFGSSNFDYRSFKYQYELNVFGNNPILKDIVSDHLKESLKNTEEFDFKKWKKRPLYKRLFEILLEPFRHFF